MIRLKSYRVGDVVLVHDVASGYPLPAGPPDGTEVRVVAFGTGSRTVEHAGHRFKVPMACIDSGFENFDLPTRP